VSRQAARAKPENHDTTAVRRWRFTIKCKLFWKIFWSKKPERPCRHPKAVADPQEMFDRQKIYFIIEKTLENRLKGISI
jgi:hypothetical protein